LYWITNYSIFFVPYYTFSTFFLRVTYSGSSIIKLNKGKGDLSRSRDAYNLPGLSFREYLEFNNIYKTVPVTLEDISSRQTELACDILSGVKPIPLIKKYWTSGYFPFYNENPEKQVLSRKKPCKPVRPQLISIANKYFMHFTCNFTHI